MSTSIAKNLKKSIGKFKNAKILVVGDIIVDHFIWGTVSRISPEAPVPVVNVTRENLLLGGAANVLNNIYALGAQATICGTIGNDFMGDQLVHLLEQMKSSTAGILKVEDRPTTKKTRIIAQSQQVVRFDREKIGEIPQEYFKKIATFIKNSIHDFDAVVVSDYNKGMITKTLMKHLGKALSKAKQNIPVVVDPKPRDPGRFKGVTIVTPNHHEAEIMSGVSIDSEESLVLAAETLMDKLGTEAVLITRGEAGMALLEKGKPIFTIPTVAKEVYDVTGAGDTVIATLTMGLAIGLPFIESATLANCAAGVVVGKVGTATASTEELLGVLP